VKNQSDVCDVWPHFSNQSSLSMRLMTIRVRLHAKRPTGFGTEDGMLESSAGTFLGWDLFAGMGIVQSAVLWHNVVDTIRYPVGLGTDPAFVGRALRERNGEFRDRV